jgi:hypothetical protein
MRKPDDSSYDSDIKDPLGQFFQRYALLKSGAEHEVLTPRQIAEKRMSADQLGMQELRVSGKGLDVDEMIGLAERFNHEDRELEAMGVDTDVSLTLSVTKKDFAGSAGNLSQQEMSNFVDSWHENPELQQAFSGIDSAGVESDKTPPAAMWQGAAQRAFRNALAMQRHLGESLDTAEQRQSLCDSIMHVTGWDEAKAQLMLDQFLEGDFNAAIEEIAAIAKERPTTEQLIAGGMPKMFGGFELATIAHYVRVLQDALRMRDALRVGDDDALGTAKLLGLTVHTGEQVQKVGALDTVGPDGNITAIGLLTQVEQALDLGADRIGHAVVLGIDIDTLTEAQLLKMGLQTEASRDEFRRRQSAIVARVRELGVVIELNITSNTEISNLRQQQHPGGEFVEQGLRVSVNTDDETTVATSVQHELERLALMPGVSRTEIAAAILEGPEAQHGAGSAPQGAIP